MDTGLITCSQCGMPLDPDQIGIIDDDGDIICIDCLAEAEDAD